MQNYLALGLCASLILLSCGKVPEVRVAVQNPAGDPNSTPPKPEVKPEVDPKAAQNAANANNPLNAGEKSQNMQNSLVSTELVCSSADMLTKPQGLGSDVFGIESMTGKDTLKASYVRAGAAQQTAEIERTPESKADPKAPLSWRGVVAGATPNAAVAFFVTLKPDTKSILFSMAHLSNIKIECQKFPALASETAVQSDLNTSGSLAASGGLGAKTPSITNIINDNSTRSSNVTNINVNPNTSGSGVVGNTVSTVNPNVTTTQTQTNPDPNTTVVTTTVNGVSKTTSSTNNTTSSFQTSGN